MWGVPLLQAPPGVTSMLSTGEVGKILESPSLGWVLGLKWGSRIQQNDAGSDCSGSQASPAVIGLVCSTGIVSFKLEHRSEDSVHFLHSFGGFFWGCCYLPIRWGNLSCFLLPMQVQLGQCAASALGPENSQHTHLWLHVQTISW